MCALAAAFCTSQSHASKHGFGFVFMPALSFHCPDSMVTKEFVCSRTPPEMDQTIESIVIGGVACGGPASVGGLLINDRILEVSGVSIVGISFREFAILLAREVEKEESVWVITRPFPDGSSMKKQLSFVPGMFVEDYSCGANIDS
ncbi:MAG: PDZ domain-containing protein [Minisyncoccia bacterium]